MKPLFLILGILSLVVGIVAIFLPVVPTTPFIILAAYLFSKSSDRLHDWMLNHKIMGPPIRSWREHGVVPIQAKLLATVLVAISISMAVFVVKAPPWGLASMGVFFAGLLTFLWTRPSKPRPKDIP